MYKTWKLNLPAFNPVSIFNFEKEKQYFRKILTKIFLQKLMLNHNFFNKYNIKRYENSANKMSSVAHGNKLPFATLHICVGQRRREAGSSGAPFMLYLRHKVDMTKAVVKCCCVFSPKQEWCPSMVYGVFKHHKLSFSSS